MGCFADRGKIMEEEKGGMKEGMVYWGRGLSVEVVWREYFAGVNRIVVGNMV